MSEIAYSLDEFVEENDFYKLSINEISEIIRKNRTDDVELICNIISKVNEHKNEDETMLLLKVVDPRDVELEECIKILSKFDKLPLCQQTCKKFLENKRRLKIDYKYEIEKRDKEIDELKRKLKYSPTPKPQDFEGYINRASKEGKIESIKYIFERDCKKIVEIKDKNGYIPINNASFNGHLEIVKGLVPKKTKRHDI